MVDKETIEESFEFELPLRVVTEFDSLAEEGEYLSDVEHGEFEFFARVASDSDLSIEISTKYLLK